VTRKLARQVILDCRFNLTENLLTWLGSDLNFQLEAQVLSAPLAAAARVEFLIPHEKPEHVCPLKVIKSLPSVRQKAAKLSVQSE
jgi:hypothetical protein